MIAGNNIQYVYQYSPCQTLEPLNDRKEECRRVFSKPLLTILVHGVRFRLFLSNISE